jgi:hypothetical protein
MDPFVNPPNIVVDDIRDITLELNVGPHMVTNTNAPQVANINPSSPKVARLENSTQGDLDYDHAPINQYLQRPKPSMPRVDVGSKLVNVVASMNHFQPPIEDSSTRRVTQKKRPINQTTIIFVGEQNYEGPHQ